MLSEAEKMQFCTYDVLSAAIHIFPFKGLVYF